jgi:hypothetical protein
VFRKRLKCFDYFPGRGINRSNAHDGTSFSPVAESAPDRSLTLEYWISVPKGKSLRHLAVIPLYHWQAIRAFQVANVKNVAPKLIRGGIREVNRR